MPQDADNRRELLAFTDRHLARIYPGAQRMDSSNYDPQPAWNMGCQLAALNAQGGARPMWLNGGFFRANGGCGCVCVSSSLRRLVFGKGVELQSDAQFRSAAAAAWFQ